MKQYGLNELRAMFRDFYVSKGHYAQKSYPLVPDKDKSLLLINSGMAPLKPFFAGLETPPAVRMTTCQKCIRTGDLENVGHTARHGTFFEMLGSFSFGDYFKKESLLWGWEFVTEVLQMPVDRLWASVYEDDDEAWGIWENEVGIDPARIVRMGKEDNFWEIGTGPCGPCSEVYFDRGEAHGCGSPDCMPGCECDRYVEFWNHVFTQYNRDDAGNYTPLAHPNIDTGLGLERLACIMQDTDSIFNVDTIRHILEGVTGRSGVAYQDGKAASDISIRIVTDHIRSVTFLISDGVIPSNEGRGYVLRRLLRRASVHGRKLGIQGLFLTELSDRVIDVSGEAYSELVEKREYIHKIIRLEEERFEATVGEGSELLGQYIEELKQEGRSVLAGDKVFRLYDTHGFNPELTREMLADHGFEIDEDGYRTELKKQQEQSRQGIRVSAAEAWAENDQVIADLGKTGFTGYGSLSGEGCVLRILADGAAVDFAGAGSVVDVVLDRTPFYAESGGQVADRGTLALASASAGTGANAGVGEGAGGDVGQGGQAGCMARVTDVQTMRGVFLHRCEVTDGALRVGDVLTAQVDAGLRNRTARNHTATHLLHRALRDVLGGHVQQAGSRVDETQLRFDFTHYEAVSAAQLAEIEGIVNDAVNAFYPVATEEMSMDEAKAQGVIALFDEKYGDTVRVVRVGDFSAELCGGTHVHSSGEVGAFKIVSESSVGAGARRIEALTGTGILEPFRLAETALGTLGTLLKTSPDSLSEKAEGLLEELRGLRRELDAVQ
ncbi:MAG: alanine--tRNA ligase, partial [Clostridiales Family XIII bacterium]|nr:alanine--tRNA ligase [Clostridiales Family XIII bacterium]